MYRVFFTEQQSNTLIWEFYVDDIEIVVGMLAVGVAITKEINDRETNKDYLIDSDEDVSNYRILVDVLEDYLTVSTINKIEGDEFGVWLASNKRFTYSLYRFRTNTFFQGIISICSTFNVDFRNYLFGYPFDKEYNQYALSGYIMAPYTDAYDVPDMDDYEEDEQDDENILEPLRRTDDIITIHDYGGNYVVTSDA